MTNKKKLNYLTWACILWNTTKLVEWRKFCVHTHADVGEH